MHSGDAGVYAIASNPSGGLMSEGDGGSAQAANAHEEYVDEVLRLIDDDVAALFGTLRRTLSDRDRANGGTPTHVVEDQRRFDATRGSRTATFAVDTVVDASAHTGRAKEFPAGQARCEVSVDGRPVDEWILQRNDESAGGYVWSRETDNR